MIDTGGSQARNLASGKLASKHHKHQYLIIRVQGTSTVRKKLWNYTRRRHDALWSRWMKRFAWASEAHGHLTYMSAHAAMIFLVELVSFRLSRILLDKTTIRPSFPSDERRTTELQWNLFTSHCIEHTSVHSLFFWIMNKEVGMESFIDENGNGALYQLSKSPNVYRFLKSRAGS